MPDFSDFRSQLFSDLKRDRFFPVRGDNGEIIGLWVFNEENANNEVFLASAFSKVGVPSLKLTGKGRAVPNNRDKIVGGYWVMLSSFPAPGEDSCKPTSQASPSARVVGLTFLIAIGLLIVGGVFLYDQTRAKDIGTSQHVSHFGWVLLAIGTVAVLTALICIFKRPYWLATKRVTPVQSPKADETSAQAPLPRLTAREIGDLVCNGLVRSDGEAEVAINRLSEAGKAAIPELTVGLTEGMSVIQKFNIARTLAKMALDSKAGLIQTLDDQSKQKAVNALKTALSQWTNRSNPESEGICFQIKRALHNFGS